MKLQIDNSDGAGARDYTAAIDAQRLPRVVRRLNQAAELRVSLVANGTDFVVPANAARITLERSNGQDVFTGYLTDPPVFEYLGWGESGPIYRYNLVAKSDEFLLDRKRLPDQPPFVARSAGDALRQLSQNLLPGAFDASGIQDLDVLAFYSANPQKKWSEHAAEIALRARASYRASGGVLIFTPLGATQHALVETDSDFSPDGLKLHPKDVTTNDVTVLGRLEPQAYVTDYFVGDNFTLRFYLSQTPFTRRNRTVLEEEYKGSVLEPTRWTITDPSSVISVSGGKLQVSGGTGTDGQTVVRFVEKIEIGGAFAIQHGDVTLSAASSGVLGGLYVSGISAPNCLAGFRITPSGAQSQIQALVNGALSGTVIATAAGHHYLFTTRFYSTEIYRREQIFHSATNPSGSGRGGAEISANIRVVLEVHDVDPAAPASVTGPSTVLYDGVLNNVPGFCSYALVNSANLNCAIAFTRLTQAVDTEVRTAPPSESYRTRLVGSLSDGAECLVTGDPALQFFPQYVPVADELIEIRYRGLGRAMARITNSTSIAALADGTDDGVRSLVRHVQAPAPRTAADCENAALALLDDASGTAWAGDYATWSDFLPGSSQDILPGDTMTVDAASRDAVFSATVREVQLEIKDLEGEHCAYKILFADDAAEPLAFEFDAAGISGALDVSAVDKDQISTNFLPSLTSATIAGVTSTTITLDAGVIPPAGGGIEVRRSDLGWGPDNDRNLVGRFNTQNFTVTRLTRVQDYFLRQFSASTPTKYSRYSAALHIGYPL